MGRPAEVAEADDSMVPLPSPVRNTSGVCCVPGMEFNTPERESLAPFTDADVLAPRSNDPGTTIPDAPGTSVCPAITYTPAALAVYV